MKLGFAALLLVGATQFSGLALSKGKVEEYVVDVTHTHIGFGVKHLLISTVRGSFKKFNGTMFFNPDDKKAIMKFDKPFLKAEVDVDSVDTGIEKRDNHLRSKDFFEVKKYPKMTFEATKISDFDGDDFVMEGILKIKNKSKKVKFKMEYTGSATAYEIKRIGFEGEAKIAREEFGLGWNNVVEAGPVVGKHVKIKLEIQAQRKADL